MTDKADAALAAQDAEVDRLIEDAMKAEEDEGSTVWPHVQEDEVSRLRPLLAAAAEMEPEDLGPEVGNWHPGLPIESEADCGKAIAWLAACRREMNEVERRKQQAIETATKWAHDRLHGVMGLKTRHDGQEAKILDYAQKHPEVFGGKKTAKFPGGSIKQREREDGHWRLKDGAEERRALVAWAQKVNAEGGPCMVKSGEPLPIMNHIQHHLAGLAQKKAAPEAVPGLEWVPPGVDYSVKTGES